MSGPLLLVQFRLGLCNGTDGFFLDGGKALTLLLPQIYRVVFLVVFSGFLEQLVNAPLLECALPNVSSLVRLIGGCPSLSDLEAFAVFLKHVGAFVVVGDIDAPEVLCPEVSSPHHGPLSQHLETGRTFAVPFEETGVVAPRTYRSVACFARRFGAHQTHSFSSLHCGASDCDMLGGCCCRAEECL